MKGIGVRKGLSWIFLFSVLFLTGRQKLKVLMRCVAAISLIRRLKHKKQFWTWNNWSKRKKLTKSSVLYVSSVEGVRKMLSNTTVTLKQTFVILQLRAWNNHGHYSRVKFSRNKSARQSSYKAWKSVTLKGNVRWQIFMATMQQPTIKTLIFGYGRTCKNSYFLSRWCIITAVIKR